MFVTIDIENAHLEPLTWGTFFWLQVENVHLRLTTWRTLVCDHWLRGPHMAHTHARTHARTHTHTHTHTHTSAYTHARTHTRAHTRTHTRAHTRTHAHILQGYQLCFLAHAHALSAVVVFILQNLSWETSKQGFGPRRWPLPSAS